MAIIIEQGAIIGREAIITLLGIKRINIKQAYWHVASKPSAYQLSTGMITLEGYCAP